MGFPFFAEKTHLLIGGDYMFTAICGIISGIGFVIWGIKSYGRNKYYEGYNQACKDIHERSAKILKDMR